MKKIFIFAAALIIILGCARVRVEAPQKPIKVDISMRLDIYQHVEKDIDAIENIVSGTKGKDKAADKQSLLNSFVSFAYAEEGLSPEVEQAALRRKDRYNELISLEEKGAVGENKNGFVEARDAKNAGSSEELIKSENSDRMLIYKAVAEKNGTSVEEVEKLYAKRLQASAPIGAPIEVLNEASGSYEWKNK